VPGLILVLVGVYLFTGIDAETTAGYIVTLHIILLIGISLIMMPAQTTGLNQLPRSLYAHGTAIMNTLQQVSGAIGTALFITIMTNGTKSYMSSSSDPTSPAETVNGLVAGMQDAFWVAFFIGIGALAIGLFVKRTQPPADAQPELVKQPAQP